MRQPALRFQKYFAPQLLFSFSTKRYQQLWLQPVVLLLSEKCQTWHQLPFYHHELSKLLIIQRKRHSFFGKGMKVAVFSLIDAQANNGEGWRKMGNNIKYERSCIRKRSDKKFKFYSLSFEMCFQHHNDFLCLAMNVPYSYSRLIHHLRICENRAQ